jgi:hypothetical protein
VVVEIVRTQRRVINFFILSWLVSVLTGLKQN